MLKKNVAFLILLFAVITAVIMPFSAYNPSMSEIIAADGSKTEYTLSDFIEIPSGGLDFSEYTESKPLQLKFNGYADESKSLTLSFALLLAAVGEKQSFTVGFSSNVSLTFTIARNGKLTVNLKSGSDIESVNLSNELSTLLVGQKSNVSLWFKFGIVSANKLSFYVTYNDKTYEVKNLSCARIGNPNLVLYSDGVGASKLYDAGAESEKVKITVKNENGEIVSPKDGNNLSFSDIINAVQTERKKFIGFEYNDKLYKTAAEIENIDENAVVIAKTITLYTENGAYIRTVEPYGIRFNAVASCPSKDGSLNDYIVDYGIMLTTKDSAKDATAFTLENLETSQATVKIARKANDGFKERVNDNLSGFSIALVNVKKENYNLVFAVRAFSVIRYDDGTEATFYSDFGNDNCRSVYDVAVNGLKNSADEANHELYVGYCDGVIDITLNGESSSLNYKSDKYSVEIGASDNFLTIKFIDVKNGFNVADNVKCVTVNGKRIVSFIYNGGQIKIDKSEI